MKRKRNPWGNLSAQIDSGEVTLSMMWHLPRCVPDKPCRDEWCPNAHWFGAVPVFHGGRP